MPAQTKARRKTAEKPKPTRVSVQVLHQTRVLFKNSDDENYAAVVGPQRYVDDNGWNDPVEVAAGQVLIVAPCGQEANFLVEDLELLLQHLADVASRQREQNGAH